MSTDRRKPVEYYLDLHYPFRVIASEAGNFVVVFPDLPGCLTQTATMEEIGSMAEEARRLWIEVEYDSGADIPLPSMPEEYSGRFNVRIPKSLHRRLVETAEDEGVSLNQLVSSLLSAGVAGNSTSEFPSSQRHGEPGHPRVLSYRLEAHKHPRNIAVSALKVTNA